MHQDALGRWQQALRRILADYLDGAYLRIRSRWTSPLWWELSPLAVWNALVDLAHASQILGQDGGDPAVSAFRNNLDLALERCQADSEGGLTAVLAEGYRLLSRLCQANAEIQPCAVPLGSRFDPAQCPGFDSGYLSPVVRLAKYIQGQMSPYLALSLIHGSIGDLHYCKGYSDLDTLLILKQDTVTDPARLRKFARVYYRSLVELYRFDPLQHHGHMIMTTVDLDCYPESWLPQAAFSDAKVVSSSNGTVLARVRDSRQDARSAFEEHVDYFRLLSAKQWMPPDAYSLKYYLSILMLLPTRYLQAKGIFCAKHESFDLAKQSMPRAEWDVMDYATQLRANWPFARSGVTDVLGHIPGLLNVQRIRSIQHVTLEHRYRECLHRFSPRWRELATELAQQMFDNLYAGESTLVPVLKVESTTAGCASSLSIANQTVYRSLDEYQRAREYYVNQVKDVRGVMAVYECGSIGAPGLSDLDFVVSVSDTTGAVDRIDARQLSIDPLPLSARSLILHDAVIVPESQMQFAHEFLPEADLKELWPRSSRVLARADLDPRTGLYAKAAKSVEKLFAYAVWFADTCQIQVLDARWAIAVLRSLVYTVSMMESVTGHAPLQSATYLTAIDQLRAHWFEEPSWCRRNSALRSLYMLGTNVTDELVESLDRFLCTSGWAKVQNLRQQVASVYPIPGTRVSVTFGAAAEQPTNPGNDRPTRGSRLVTLPRSFMHILALYAQCAPRLSRVLTANVLLSSAHIETAPQTDFERYLCERARHLEAQTRFLLQHRFWFGSYLPGQLLYLPQNGQ